MDKLTDEAVKAALWQALMADENQPYVLDRGNGQVLIDGTVDFDALVQAAIQARAHWPRKDEQ